MKSITRILLLSVALALPSLAAAKDVSETDAKVVEAKLLSLMTKDAKQAGAVSVEAAGDRFNVSLDIRKALEQSIAPWTLKEANSILHSLRPVADGLWEYSGQGEIRIASDLGAANRSSSVTINVGSFENRGTFDENLRFIRNGEFKSADLEFSTRSAQESIKVAAKDYSFKLSLAEAQPGLGDISTDVAAHEISETVGAFPKPEVKLAGEALTGRFLFEDVDLKGIGELVDFWNSSAKGKTVDALSETERAALADIVARHAPFVRQVGENTRVDGVSLSWAGNAVRMDNLSYRWAVEGIGGDAALVLGAQMKNPSVEADAMPAALKKALPTEAGLSLRYSGFKLSAMWEALADPKQAREAFTTKDYFTSRILPDRKVKASFDGSYIRSGHYDFVLSGRMEFPLERGGRPENVDLTVTAREFDGTIKFLQDLAKEDPRFGQASFVAMMAKGLGKLQPDGSILWHLQTDASGAWTVNGQAIPRG